MAERKFQDLTIKNNFMFGAVMAEPKNCKGIIELVLGIEVDHVEAVSYTHLTPASYLK